MNAISAFHQVPVIAIFTVHVRVCGFIWSYVHMFIFSYIWMSRSACDLMISWSPDATCPVVTASLLLNLIVFLCLFCCFINKLGPEYCWFHSKRDRFLRIFENKPPPWWYAMIFKTSPLHHSTSRVFIVPRKRVKFLDFF